MSISETPILLFDVPNSGPETAWTPNVTRTRFVLNYKKIPHTTQWVENPDIKPLFQQLGIPPTGKDDVGEDQYTCPAIKITPGGGEEPYYVTDSFKIAEFLDEKYPNPPLFKDRSPDVQRELVTKVRVELVGPLSRILVYGSFKLIHESSRPYWHLTRERLFKMKLEEFVPNEETLVKLRRNGEAAFTKFLKEVGFVGPYVFGQDISFLDFAIASILKWAQLVAESDLWVHMKEWDGGLWGRLFTSLENQGLFKVRR